MTRPLRADVALRPYAEGDFALLERLLGDPAMMVHLGGPESSNNLRARHERYVASDPRKGGLFTIVVGSEATAVGWTGYWESSWQGELVWEMGWHVLPAHQGQGIATAGVMLALERAHTQGPRRAVHAFPAVENVASNALCARLGFTRLGEATVEYPAGRPMRSCDWRRTAATA
jgi:RimJ/RimL family protein N-acetyltransferase